MFIFYWYTRPNRACCTRPIRACCTSPNRACLLIINLHPELQERNKSSIFEGFFSLPKEVLSKNRKDHKVCQKKPQKFKNQILQSGMSLRYPSGISIENVMEFEAHFDHPQSLSFLQRNRFKNTKERMKNQMFTNYLKSHLRKMF